MSSPACLWPVTQGVRCPRPPLDRPVLTWSSDMDLTILAAVTERPDADSALAEQIRRIGAALRDLDLEVRWTHRIEDALATISSDASLAALLVAWEAAGAEELLTGVTRRFRGLPVFLIASQHEELPLWVYEVIQGYVFPLEDTPAFIAGRIAHAAEQYADRLLPPFFGALRRLDD